MTRALGLLRVCSANQVDGYSLDAQEREITRWCQAKGYEVTFSIEDGVSARSDKLEKRPQLQAIIAAAGRGEFDVLVVHTLNRFARNQGVQRRVLEALGRAGVGFATVMEGHEFITPHGKLLMSVMGAVNEFFSDQLGVQVAKAARERVELGRPVGPIPFGYKSLDPKTVPALVTEEATALVDVFQGRAYGMSMGVLASGLNDRGFVTRVCDA